LVCNWIASIRLDPSFFGTHSRLRSKATFYLSLHIGDDPVERGLVTSLARPAGNLTGVSFLTGRLMPKRLELVSELVPQVKIVALLVNPSNASAERVIRDLKEAARAKELELHLIKASNESEFDAAFISFQGS